MGIRASARREPVACGILAGVAADTDRRRTCPDGIGDPPAGDSNVVTIQTGSRSRSPLFCVHAEAGDVALYYGIARHLPVEQPVLGLRANATADPGTGARLEQMAGRHALEIRRVQPEGPYLIAGECTGGALAYEIAQQLRAHGQEVDLLALVDAFPSGKPPLRRFMPRPLYRLLHRAHILAFHVGNLVRLDMSAKLAYVAPRAQRARVALTSRASGALGRSSALRQPQLTFREALAAYTPGPYTGSMILFRAARLPVGIDAAPDLGWAQLVENLQVETVPGYFTTPISEPGVQILAERLSRYLASVAARA